MAVDIQVLPYWSVFKCYCSCKQHTTYHYLK